MFYPDPGKNTVVHAWTDHADFVITTDDPAYAGSGRDVDIHAVAVDPVDTTYLAMAVNSADSPRPGSPAAATRLLASTDRGRTWTRLGELGTERVLAIGIDGSGSSRTVRAVAESGVYEAASGVFKRFEAPAPGGIVSASFGRDAQSNRALLYVTMPVGARTSRAPGSTAPPTSHWVRPPPQVTGPARQEAPSDLLCLRVLPVTPVMFKQAFLSFFEVRCKLQSMLEDPRLFRLGQIRELP